LVHTKLQRELRYRGEVQLGVIPENYCLVIQVQHKSGFTSDMLAALLLSLLPNLNTYVPVPKRNRDNLPPNVQGEGIWIKDVAQLGYWVKHEKKWYPVEFYS
jgi:hypothetical protein